ncbi:cupin domain-containing protein [Oscillospiraceae bacterium MB08-C2-2]|nr:cupin domain-containing protein [Oscillospiraceae bacterium MB08-C2-2]
MENEIVCNIKEAAEQVGVSPGTIRNWEKDGLFSAHRNSSNYRIYRFQDIEYLKKLKSYSIDQKLNIQAIKKLMETDLSFVYSGFPSESNSKSGDEISAFSIKKKELFEKWKGIRERRKLTLEDVSKATGISISYLSRIENMNANVSLEIINILADYYGETLTYFYETTAFAEEFMVREKERCQIESSLKGVCIESLINRKNTVMRPTIFTVLPKSGQTHFHSHRGEEFIFVLEGQVTVTLEDDKEYILHQNDSVSFPSLTKHKWQNTSNQICKLIWVHSPLNAT